MTRARRGLACASALLLMAGCAAAEDTRAAFASLAAAADEAGAKVVQGEDGWLYLPAELRHLGLPPFWGPAAGELSRAKRPDARDPLPAILDFKAQLDRAGVDLLLVPVPAKAAIYPRLPGVDAGEARIDAVDAAFFEVLRDHGVDVLDLAPRFSALRDEVPRSLYCKQDTHWSGAGAELAAAEIAAWLREQAWFEQGGEAFASEEREVSLDGDLRVMLGDPALPRETVTLRFVGRRTAGGLEPVPPSRESPVLLLADSHGLVFHAGGDMHARGAGLADQLALELGFPVDVVAVRGSGATPARISLLRRKDQLAGKRAVIWALSAREFTESVQGWRKVPIIPEN